MKHLLCALALVSCATALQTHAEEVLWNLTFSDLPAGQALAEVPFTPACTGPQRVTQSQENSLVGAQSVGELSPALLFTKETTTNYTPAFTLKASKPYTAGVITVTFDIIFDRLTPTAERPVETLMAFPFINGQGGSDTILVIACEGSSNLVISGTGLKKNAHKTSFKVGAVAHIKAVLDLDKHTFQAFVNEIALSDADQDNIKYSSFLGFTVRDGTALGGNKGAAFSAGIGNLLIKCQ